MYTDLIVDANSLYARGFFATKYSTARACAAAFNIISSMLNENSKNYAGHVDRALLCWDGGAAKTDKNRGSKPEGYHEEKKIFMEFCQRVMGIPSYGEGGVFEADDSVCFAARRSVAEGNRVIVCSHDKDIQQLASSKVGYYCLASKRVLTKKEIAQKWKVLKPRHIALYLALVGDRVDGIKGVPNMGPKKASTLMDRVVVEGMSFNQAVSALTENLSEADGETFMACLCNTYLGYDARLEKAGIPLPLPYKTPPPADMPDAYEFMDVAYANFYASKKGVVIDEADVEVDEL